MLGVVEMLQLTRSSHLPHAGIAHYRPHKGQVQNTEAAKSEPDGSRCRSPNGLFGDVWCPNVSHTTRQSHAHRNAHAQTDRQTYVQIWSQRWGDPSCPSSHCRWASGLCTLNEFLGELTHQLFEGGQVRIEVAGAGLVDLVPCLIKGLFGGVILHHQLLKGLLGLSLRDLPPPVVVHLLEQLLQVTVEFRFVLTAHGFVDAELPAGFRLGWRLWLDFGSGLTPNRCGHSHGRNFGP
mmetsp:Transcript_69317/g.122382  ORF Transcript_69317/g.122382 Transcript_69317/m.122382 type:complete len:236 (-) Transcript_69317:2048-2755(-)